MADNTKIEWADATGNAVNGCDPISPGCTHCYAMRQAHRFPVRQGLTTKTKGGMVWTGEVRFNDKALLQPLKWKRPRRIFWNAHGDLFHENVPDLWIDRVFAVCALTPQHQHLILTKRSARMREYLTRQVAALGMSQAKIDSDYRAMEISDGQPWFEARERRWPLPNVWLGVSVEDQTRADLRIPDLLATPAAIRFISAEPLLGPVDLRRIREGGQTIGYHDSLTGGFSDPELGEDEDDECAWVNVFGSDVATIDWVIAGGESGPKARGSCAEVEQWMQSLLDQCAAAGVAFFGKQNYKKQPLPERLLVREFPA